MARVPRDRERCTGHEKRPHPPGLVGDGNGAGDGGTDDRSSTTTIDGTVVVADTADDDDDDDGGHSHMVGWITAG